MEKSLQELTSLFEKYNGNTYITSKIQHHINHTLPGIIENLHKQQVEKEIKKITFNEAVDEVSQLYLNRYYYIPCSELFISYDETNFTIDDESDIQYELLRYLRENKQYLDMKHKINQQVVKKIKENSLTTAIPESETIQGVISLFFPSVFSSKHEAQYFLTIIGDNILKKETNLNHFVSTPLKKIVNSISENIHTILGVSLMSFKVKFHDHNYDDSRLIQSNIAEYDINHLKQKYLNIIAVSCYYSKRYGSSDSFVRTKIMDNEVKSYIFRLKNNKPSNMVDGFIYNMLSIKDTNNKDNKMSYRSIIYLWKLYLEKSMYPSVMFLSTFKTLLISKLTYDEDTDSFIGVNSPFLPFIKSFLDFWNSEVQIVHDPLESYDYELEELTFLFKKYCDDTDNVSLSINEKNILNAINHFFPDASVINSKFITNISCRSWDKVTSIKNTMESFKEHAKEQGDIKSYSINHLYKFYCRHENNTVPIASKSFFENFVKDTYGEHIKNCSIASSWFE